MSRPIEILLAVALLLIATPILLLCILLIRLESKGPAIFRQVRVGKAQEPFTLYKLRTMSIDTRDAATHEVSAAQVTRVGRFLRKAKIDELPQLINVLQRSMSFVGPRPCLPSQAEVIAEREKRGVFAVAPGITGIAQVRHIDMSQPEKLAEADAEYIAQRSLNLDLSLLAQTFTGAGRGDRVRG